MENEIINCLATEIVEKFKGKLDIEEEMELFLKTPLNIENKERALELLYLCQLYSNAYVGPDPRGKSNLLSNVHSVLNAQSEEDFKNKIVNLEKVVETLKNAEIHPILTTKTKLEDKQKYKDGIF